MRSILLPFALLPFLAACSTPHGATASAQQAPAAAPAITTATAATATAAAHDAAHDAKPTAAPAAPAAAAAATPTAAAQTAAAPAATAIALPDAEGGLDLDDLHWSARLGRVLLPAGPKLLIIDQATGKIDAIPGFGGTHVPGSREDEGTSSCDEGTGLLFAIDHSQPQVDVVDPGTRAILTSAPLASGPDYVRFVAGAREIWVTEPEAAQIEIFTLPAGDHPVPVHAGVIAVPGGPEALVIDEPRGHAYCNLWKDGTVVIDLKQRAILATWPNGCSGGRGLALDGARGFLFVGCSEGRAAVLDLAHDGKLLSSATTGAGVDIIDYDAGRGHLYVAGGKAATLTILGVSGKGELSVLGAVPTAKGARAAITDSAGHAFVADPRGGKLLVIADTFPASAR